MQRINDMSDWDLVQAYARDRSEAAFDRIVARYWPMVLGVCRREAGDATVAEDAAQVTFLVLARRAAGLTPRADLASWLFATARLSTKNVARQEARRRAAEMKARDGMDLRGEPAESAWPEIEPYLNDAVLSLRPADRAVIMLRYFEGRSTAETAATLGINEGAARARLNRAIERLRGYFQRRGLLVTSAVLAALLESGYSCAADAAAPAALAATAAGMAAGGGAASQAPLVALAQAVQRQAMLAKATAATAAAGAVAIAGVGVLSADRMFHSNAGAASPANMVVTASYQAGTNVINYEGRSLLTSDTDLPIVITGLTENGEVIGWQRTTQSRPQGRPMTYGIQTFIVSPASARYVDHFLAGRSSTAARIAGTRLPSSQPVLWSAGSAAPLPLPARGAVGEGDVGWRDMAAGRVGMPTSGETHLCFWKAGKVTDLTGVTKGLPLIPTAIDDAGDILCLDTHRSPVTFFLIRRNGTLTDLRTNGAVMNGWGEIALLRPSDDGGAVVAMYSAATGRERKLAGTAGTVFVRAINQRSDVLFERVDMQHKSAAFLYTGGRTIAVGLPVIDPGSASTGLFALNDRLQIAGQYVLADGKTHVFLFSRSSTY